MPAPSSPTYGDMADAFARNEVTVSAIGWEAVAVWAKAEGQDDRLHDPARKAPACSWTACACRRTARTPSSAYKMINHIISVEPQKIFATEQSAGITNLKAVPTLPAELARSPTTTTTSTAS